MIQFKYKENKYSTVKYTEIEILLASDCVRAAKVMRLGGRAEDMQ